MAADGAGDPAERRAAAEPQVAAERARLYDLDMADDQAADVDLYLALARSIDGPILELACGSGRICVPLAAAGHAVTGVDHDRQMLDRAQAAWQGQAAVRDGGSLEIVEDDVTALDLGRRFALVILALNGLLMLRGREAQLAALRVIARHLAPGGRAVLDAVLPAPDDLVLYDGRLELAWLRDDPATGEQVAKLWAARYEPATGVARIDTLYEIWPAGGGPLRRLARSDEMHLLGAHELLDLAERAGLQPVTVAGDYELAPFGPDSPRIVLVGSLL